MMNNVRRTKIIGTVGPATESFEALEQLVLKGLDVVRINMSHATDQEARNTVERVRKLSLKHDRHIALLMDLQGPAIRTGDLSTALNLNPGERIALTVRGEQSEEEHSVDVNYDDLIEDIHVGNVVMVDNGNIQLKVLEKQQNHLTCEVLTEGILGSRRHINLPGIRVKLPALTEKDIRNVALGIELGVDFIAMSFVREAKDVVMLQELLSQHKAPQKIIAKLEDQEGVRNTEAIAEVADGIMVARGDLGIECPYEELPIIQRRIVKICLTKGIPVIVATHMLESMIGNALPTRAEITDVSNAVFEQADAIMLSGETSVGQYPSQCVEVMNRIALRVERSGGADYAKLAKLDSLEAKLVKGASVLAHEVEADALIVFTRTGRMARYAAWMRTLHTKVYAFTNNRDVVNRLALYWGIRPFLIDFAEENPLENVEKAITLLKDKELIEQGNYIIAITQVEHKGKLIDSIQVEKVD
ncbi:MAG: pyruvate kinase [Candidatus Scalindua sp.]|nr:pyruvate kinase [Candidatus Scalindua sp.]